MGLPVHERAAQARVSIRYNGPRPEGAGLGRLRLAEPTGFGSGDRRRRSDASHPHGSAPDRMEPMARRVVMAPAEG